MASHKKLLQEAVGLMGLVDVDGHRAHGISAVEDAAVLALCERHGYGAVMDSAARQWFLKGERDGTPGCNHTTFHCAAVVKEFMKRATESLKEAADAK